MTGNMQTNNMNSEANNDGNEPIPGYLTSLSKEQLFELDVRPSLAKGIDPFSLIMERLKSIGEGEALKIINTFEPVPLINILRKQGFEVFVQKSNEKLIETYFYRKPSQEKSSPSDNNSASISWEQAIEKYKNNMETMDVRSMEMPLPMISILESLDKLTPDKALFVYHKRIPVMLFPELIDRNFNYSIHEISSDEVHVLIYKN